MGSPAYFFDEGASIEWTPNSEKLTTSAPGVKIASYDDEWAGAPVSVIEMDGKLDELDEGEVMYLESHLCNAGTKYFGELAEQIIKNKGAPGSEDGTGLFQTVCSFKIREAYEALKKPSKSLTSTVGRHTVCCRGASDARRARLDGWILDRLRR